MGLTRHLYAEDEVVAALQFCVLRGRAVEAAFWCEELVHSEMADQLIDALRRIWLYGFGIGALSWYRAFEELTKKEELVLEELVGLVVGLCRIGTKGRRDITYLILAGTGAEAEQVNYSIPPKGLTGADAYFLACVEQGRCISAWRALAEITNETLRLTAEHKHREAGLNACALLLDYPALAVAALCLVRGELATRLAEPLPGTLSEVERARSEWEPLLGRRRRRLYPIPHECLYWLTERGSKSVYESSEKRLRGSLEHPAKLWGSIYWDSVADSLGGWEAIRNDPEVRMTFYDTYFPDDTPDEWSTAEREKSHGIGALQPGVDPRAEKFLRTWFGRLPSAVIWNGFNDACKGLADKKNWGDIVAISERRPLNLVRLTRRVFTVVGVSE
jgi:hypothetical protein